MFLFIIDGKNLGKIGAGLFKDIPAGRYTITAEGEGYNSKIK